MRIYLTHCSKEKDPSLKGTGIAVTPNQLYTNCDIQNFMQRCHIKNVNWGILSDLYGVYLAKERHVWYEKHPDTVTIEEKKLIIQDFDDKLSLYNEILFFARPRTFHPFYKKVLRETDLCKRIQAFYEITRIE